MDEVSIKIPTLPLNVLWKNENLAVVHKPAGMVVEECATTSVLHEVLEIVLARQLNLDKVFPLHRLDKDTEGIMVVALKENCAYDHLMKQRKFIKAYKAFYTPEGFKLQNFAAFYCPHGKFVWSYSSECLCDVQDYTLYTIGINENKRGVRLALNGTKECETLMRPIQGGYDCILITGRTHQIRLTMKSLGKVIAGDALYGSRVKGPLQLFSYYIDIDSCYL